MVNTKIAGKWIFISPNYYVAIGGNGFWTISLLLIGILGINYHSYPYVRDWLGILISGLQKRLATYMNVDNMGDTTIIHYPSRSFCFTGGLQSFVQNQPQFADPWNDME